MKISDFEEKYGAKGGMNKLVLLRQLGFSKNYIARHFGVTSNAVYQWQWIFFSGQKDLSIPSDVVSANMIDFAKQNELKEFRFAFKGHDLYLEILKKVKKEVYGL
jgi:hypothetical protein